jgi:hypothetical protein
VTREYKKQYRQEWHKKNPVGYILHTCRASAASRGFEFSITKEDIGTLPTHCPVLGIELDYSRSGPKYNRQNAPSLDRWDNTKGYIPGNVVVISWRANWLKHDGTIAELEAVLHYMKHGIA